jgi:thymidine phosphorylase
MNISELIRRKRDGEELPANEIADFVAELAAGTIASEQVAAMAMAIYFNSMTDRETAALTRAMARSGEMLDWSRDRLPGPVADKHSTGGVGDKVSFALAPIVAACGVFVPMISGRGLGHSGGTLDKIESIPGYQTAPDVDLFRRTVKSVGCAIIGQTDAIAPADRRLYAIRDVTATVESMPLIVASILSKKAAAGLSALVMDVKTGSGAFMPSLASATALARQIVATGAEIGIKTRALITDMSEPLGRTAGNAVEIQEILDYLVGAACEPRLDALIRALSVELLTMTGVAPDAAAAAANVEQAIRSGRAAEIFGRMVRALGGPSDLIERRDFYLPIAKRTAPIYAATDGYLAAVDARKIGLAIVGLKGGRARAGDRLDLSTGFTGIAPIGERIDRNRPLAIAHAATDDDLARAICEYRDACTISPAPPLPRPLIYDHA